MKHVREDADWTDWTPLLVFLKAEEEQTIRMRFLTQTSVSRGEPPFRKLTKK